ncbi:hypothetical protein, partial [Paenibacillus sp. SAFN-054]|uniref:hypothetical protein n=1 Tax=Paenibacillus sp. SAFN-054 TaxID=3436865 RepID=UPI003F7EAD79
NLLRDRLCKQSLFSLVVQFSKIKFFSVTTKVFHRRQLLYYIMSGYFMQAFFKIFFEAFRLLRIHFIVFSWPEI